jgi:hypothetical protein
MRDERLRELYGKALERRRPEERSACPSPDRLLALADGRLSEGDAAAIADHAMGCAFCRADYALLRSIAQSRPDPVWSRHPYLAIAASVVLIAGVATMWRAAQPRDGVNMRGAASEVQLVPPVARAGEPITLIWRSVAGSSRYTVEILDSTGTPRYGATSMDTLLVVPDSVRLTPHVEHRWWVHAIFADGREVRSAVDTFRIR